MNDTLPGDLCVGVATSCGYDAARGIRMSVGRLLCGETCLVIGTETGPFDAPMAYVVTQRGHAFWVYSFDCGLLSRVDTT